MTAKRKKYTFEESLEALEQAVSALESGDMPLDAAIQEFESGMKAVKRCRTDLSRAEGKIRKLVEQSDGEYVEELLDLKLDTLNEGEVTFE
ncbi:exodeoxyribonuclease VII small subunit [Chitinivibrio alkaliphilus]|uniref:Exodeoxyribonuclease 7 small subunit n=1 Tax=Chitinivibrio alkaliphilus ACht1 TaxID=1313304 RepID=U7D7L1_9BACT|nr:exodeoxyribonuclease VII small subunit [Chitinivibrio alkaliphilus]ERP38940.1 exonuclease VII small subunit [Chitinivibrio alkaliphilus ACht1]